MSSVVLAVEASEVCDLTREAADDMFARAAADLRLEGVRLQWFREEDPADAAERDSWPPLASEVEALYQMLTPDLVERLRLLQRSAEAGGPLRWIADRQVAGFVIALQPDVAWIRADLDPGEAAYTVAHELRHAQQAKIAGGRFGEFVGACRESYEASAHGYARSIYARWPLRHIYPRN